MSYSQTIAISLGSTKTGLTLTAQLVDYLGADYGELITEGFAEIGGGNYLWYATLEDGWQGGVKILDGETLLAFGAISAGGEGGADPLLNTVPGSYPSGTAGAALGRIGMATIEVTSPMADDGSLDPLYSGDDYQAIDGRALGWTEKVPNSWPSLNGSVTFNVPAREFSKALTVVSDTAPKQVSLELTAEETDQLEGYHNFYIRSADAHTPAHKAVFVTGHINVVAPQGAA